MFSSTGFCRPGAHGVLAALLSMALLGGCTIKGSTRIAAYYNVETPVPYTVQASGYASSDGDPGSNSHYSVSFNLRTAQPFIFIFPDGYRAHSRTITASDLALHLAPIVTDARGRLASSRSRPGDLARDDIYFVLGKDGLAEHLWLYACRRRMPRILATADGSQVFDFPLRERELRALVGPPSRSGTGWGGLAIDCEAPG